MSIPGDDGGFGKEIPLISSDHVRSDLRSAGAVYSVKKSQRNPSDSMEWLEFAIDGPIYAAPHRVKESLNIVSSD